MKKSAPLGLYEEDTSKKPMVRKAEQEKIFLLFTKRVYAPAIM